MLGIIVLRKWVVGFTVVATIFGNFNLGNLGNFGNFGILVMGFFFFFTTFTGFFVDTLPLGLPVIKLGLKVPFMAGELGEKGGLENSCFKSFKVGLIDPKAGLCNL
jgi:hypothetical protein